MANGTVVQEQDRTREMVRDAYAKTARGEARSCCDRDPTCCDADEFAQSVGYTEAELATLPDGANMGLSCGNPTAIAELKAGEVVVDLGSGGGFDIFLAGQQVGDTGRAIGVDMTPAMLSKARNNTTQYQERTGLDNVEFRLGEIEHLPIADASVDVVISNCVINLSPDKRQVWREIARILKPGGRVAVSDLAWLKPLPESVREMAEALVGCIAGAVLVSETEAMAMEAGLSDIALTPRQGYADSMSQEEGSLHSQILAELPAGEGVGDYVTSLEVRATRPLD